MSFSFRDERIFLVRNHAWLQAPDAHTQILTSEVGNSQPHEISSWDIFYCFHITLHTQTLCLEYWNSPLSPSIQFGDRRCKLVQENQTPAYCIGLVILWSSVYAASINFILIAVVKNPLQHEKNPSTPYLENMFW